MLNGLDQRDEYETERCYHPTFRRLLEYAEPVLVAKGAKSFSDFSWRFFEAPLEPDSVSCGLFAIYYMEHFRSHFKKKQKVMLNGLD
ncbi:hypothetical protein LINGRAHAP2_LOCUS27973 [Linum grandiflorum]